MQDVEFGLEGIAEVVWGVEEDGDGFHAPGSLGVGEVGDSLGQPSAVTSLVLLVMKVLLTRVEGQIRNSDQTTLPSVVA